MQPVGRRSTRERSPDRQVGVLRLRSYERDTIYPVPQGEVRLSAQHSEGPRLLRVLLLAYHYPPDAAVGGVRPSRLVAQLVAAGHEVDAITAVLHDEAPGLRDRGAGWRVFSVRRWRTPRDWYLRISRARKVASAEDADQDAADGPGPGMARPAAATGWLRRQVLSLTWMPDHLHGFLPAASGLARRLHRERPYDLVFTTAPPLIMHVTGWWVSRRLRRPWVMEYRDPWIGNKPREVITAWSTWADKWLERRCLSRARLVVTVTEAFARHLRERRRPPGRVECVRNGIRNGSGTRLADPPRGRFVIRHMGTVYARRDPMPLFRALADLRASGDANPETFALEFVGFLPSFRGRTLMDLAAEAGVADLVRFQARVSEEECRILTQEASVLLLLAQHQPLQVPNKLYDYLAAGRPVLALADPEGETALMLAQVGGHAVLSPEASPAAIAEAIRELRRGPREIPIGDGRELLAAWSVERQLGRLVELIEEVALDQHVRAPALATAVPSPAG